jgi:hypothetical protein
MVVEDEVHGSGFRESASWHSSQSTMAPPLRLALHICVHVALGLPDERDAGEAQDALEVEIVPQLRRHE